MDAALSDNFLVRGHRARLRLAGSSGVPPAMHEWLLGVGRMADDPDIRVEVKFDELEQKIVTRALPRASDLIMPDGRRVREIFVDEKDISELPKISQRERRRRGLPQLSSEQLIEEINKFDKKLITTNGAHLIFEKSYSFAFVRHAMIKIAYELAFLWLGDDYVSDPSAAELRDAIVSSDPNSTNTLPAYVMNADECSAFYLWPPNKQEHMAYVFADDDGVAIAVRVFDIHAAFVWVTKEPARYLVGGDADQKLRFLRMDAVTGQKQDVPLTDEFFRLSRSIINHRGLKPTTG